MNKHILLTVLIVLMWELIYSQPSFQERIKNYDHICFCNIGLSHPMKILDLDNNMEILFAFKKGQTLHKLDRMGIKYTDTQMKLMEFSGLIEKKDSIYHTIIPILSKNETIQLRKAAKKIAKNIISLFQFDSERLLKTLNSQGFQKNSYSLFFAFVLDGLVWDILEQKNDIEERRITNEKPFWNGTFWMIEPKRKFSCGTNSLSSGNYSIRVNWSNNSIISVSSYKMLRKFLNDYKLNGKVTKQEVFKAFEKNDLFNKSGELKIPVIKAERSNVIYTQSRNIAEKVAEYLRSYIDYSTILYDYNGLTKGQKITILYHETMWDILDVMEGYGQISKPVAFGNPQEAKSEDLKDLIFILEN